jgi:hypothetical protein
MPDRLPVGVALLSCVQCTTSIIEEGFGKGARSPAAHTGDFNISRAFTDYIKYQILLFHIFRVRKFEI